MSAWAPGTGVVADETRVPHRPPLKIIENVGTAAASKEEALEALKRRVASREEELWLVSSDSKFYARWCLQGATPRTKAKVGVVLIPGHPTYETTGCSKQSMNSRLILTLADELQKAGIPTIRFDYRGVGQSRGTFNSVTCVRDVVAAAQALCGARGETGPCASSVMCAHSFGAATVLGNIYTPGCKKFVSISHGHGFGETLPDGWKRPVGQLCDPPNNALRKLYNRTAIFFTTMRITIPKLWIVGGADPLTPRGELCAWLKHHSPGKGALSTVVQLAKTMNHDCAGFELQVAATVLDWVQDSKTCEIVYQMDFASGAKDDYTID